MGGAEPDHGGGRRRSGPPGPGALPLRSRLGGTLYLKGRKTEEKEEKGKTWHRVERSYGTFTRAITLPSAVNAERIEAKSKDGVLTITLPKREEAKPKQIQIKT